MDAVKPNSITEAKAIEMFGSEIVEKLKGENCDFTSRCIDACFDVVELSASVKVDDETTLVILYLVSKSESEDLEMDQYDYSCYTFEVV